MEGRCRSILISIKFYPKYAKFVRGVWKLALRDLENFEAARIEIPTRYFHSTLVLVTVSTEFTSNYCYFLLDNNKDKTIKIVGRNFNAGNVNVFQKSLTASFNSPLQLQNVTIFILNITGYSAPNIP